MYVCGVGCGVRVRGCGRGVGVWGVGCGGTGQKLKKLEQSRKKSTPPYKKKLSLLLRSSVCII